VLSAKTLGISRAVATGNNTQGGEEGKPFLILGESAIWGKAMSWKALQKWVQNGRRLEVKPYARFINLM